MFRAPTLLVVGAGASAEVGLPTGKALVEKVCGKLELGSWGRSENDADPAIREALKYFASRHGNESLDFKSLKSSAARVRAGLPLASSVDYFIDSHRGDKGIEVCAKLAIAKSILEGEHNGSLGNRNVVEGRMQFDGTKDTWFEKFFQLLTEEVSHDQIHSIFQNVTFITFNYDRCIEHYLAHALQSYYSIDLTEAQGVVDRVRIIHVYGKTGDLPWQSGGQTKIDFGQLGGIRALVDVVQDIKTFTSRVRC